MQEDLVILCHELSPVRLWAWKREAGEGRGWHLGARDVKTSSVLPGRRAEELSENASRP